MATTTTNYGFDIPQSTDLVKDGATAIATLGQDIDTAMNTALGTKKAGMVLLNTTSFSAVASFSLPANTFSSTYDNYEIVMSGKASAGASIGVRMRAAGSDNSTASSYVVQSLISNGATVAAARDTNNIWTYAADFDTTLINGLVMDLFDPFLTTPTGFVLVGFRSNSGAYTFNNCGTHNQNTSYDSMTFIASAGTITGKVSVFGVNK
jgi:hypothetical protein